MCSPGVNLSRGLRAVKIWLSRQYSDQARPTLIAADLSVRIRRQIARPSLLPCLHASPSWHRRELTLEFEPQGSWISQGSSLLSACGPRGAALSPQRPVGCNVAKSNCCARLFESRAEQLDPQTRSSSSSRGQGSRGGWQAAITGCFASSTGGRRQVPSAACRASARRDDSRV